MHTKIIALVAVWGIAGCDWLTTHPDTIDLTPTYASIPEAQRLRYMREIRAGADIQDFNLTGRGVRVVLMGEVADASHPEIAHRIHKQYNTFSQKGVLLQGQGNQAWHIDLYGHDDGHGTHIAGTLAAECDDRGLRGVACGATLDLYDIGAYENAHLPRKGWNSDLPTYILEAFADALDHVVETNTSRIVSGSFNIEAPYIPYTPAGLKPGLSMEAIYQTVHGEIDSERWVTFDHLSDKTYLDTMARKSEDDDLKMITLIPFSSQWQTLEKAIARYQKHGGVYIATESNTIFGRTSLLNAMPTISDQVDPDLWINAVMVYPTGYAQARHDTIEEAYNYTQTHPYKAILNSCGEVAKEYCMVVPSYNVLSSVTPRLSHEGMPLLTIDGRTFQPYTGHSMGAPMIAGALALMAEYNAREHLGYTTRDLVRILKQSANRSFDGYDPKRHGVGMLDVKAALQAMKSR